MLFISVCVRSPEVAMALSVQMHSCSATRTVFCEGIVFWEFGGDRRWIK